MPNWLQRGIQGAIQGATGSTNAILYNLQRLKEEEMLKRREKSQAILDSLNQARIGELNRPEPAKLPNLGEIKAKLYQDNPDAYYETLRREAEATRAPGKIESDEPEINVDSEGKITIKGKNAGKVRTEMINLGIPQYGRKSKADDITPQMRKDAGEIASMPYYYLGDKGQSIYLPQALPFLKDGKTPAVLGKDYFANEAYGKRDSILADWTGAQPQPAPNKTGALMPFDLGGMTGGGAAQVQESLTPDEQSIIEFAKTHPGYVPDWPTLKRDGFDIDKIKRGLGL